MALARTLCAAVLRAYWDRAQPGPLPQSPPRLTAAELPHTVVDLVPELAGALARIGPDRAFYELGRLYTGLLPASFRSRYGVYYTPPELTERLLDQATLAGVDWAICRVLDPACGGGAFLAPSARRMLAAVRQSYPELAPTLTRAQISARLQGYEIDPFAAWISRAAVDAVL